MGGESITRHVVPVLASHSTVYGMILKSGPFNAIWARRRSINILSQQSKSTPNDLELAGRPISFSFLLQVRKLFGMHLVPRPHRFFTVVFSHVFGPL